MTLPETRFVAHDVNFKCAGCLSALSLLQKDYFHLIFSICVYLVKARNTYSSSLFVYCWLFLVTSQSPSVSDGGITTWEFAGIGENK